MIPVPVEAAKNTKNAVWAKNNIELSRIRSTGYMSSRVLGMNASEGNEPRKTCPDCAVRRAGFPFTVPGSD